MVKTGILSWVRCFGIVVSILTAFMAGESAASTLGQNVTNTAFVTFNGGNGERVTVLTNPAEFVIQAARTSSTVEFFRYAPSAPEAQRHRINGSDYSPSASTNGPFIPVGPALRTNGVPIDTSGALPLTPASSYLSGELMFVRVTDIGQNGDPNRIETVIVTVRVENGDTITLRLYESGPNTGEFWAYVLSSRDASPPNDIVLTTPSSTTITAVYVDSFDSSEVSIDTALVDPYGRVFNALTGDLIDNAIVTLIDASTNEPAQVFGIDGVSRYPSTVLTGQATTDESGLVYDIRPGEFRFPLAALGEYYVRVEPPEGLSFASVLGPSNFTNLSNAPFVILNTASYGQTFVLAGTEPLNFDIPVDSSSDLVLNKLANPSIGDVGDFINYTIRIENRGQNGTPVVLHDTLPRGFRYVPGTAKLQGQAILDPEISSSGRDLAFGLGVLAVTEQTQLSYVVNIGANAGQGEAVNTVVAVDGNNENISNISRATVRLREDLFRTTSTIIGRISEQSCDGDDDWARKIERGIGVEGVRLYMETGAYAITDADGLYHFDAVSEGTHVVQLDEETLPRGYAPMVCEESSRYAFRATSKFVEVKGGKIWRANFYLKRTGEVFEEEIQEVFNDQIEYKNYDANWLASQTPDAAWVYPSQTRTPSRPSVNIGIKHGVDERVELSLNGRKVSQLNFEATDSDTRRRVMMSRWRGVDVLEGENRFSAQVKNQAGHVVKTLTRNIYYVKNIARAIALPDQSILVADGRTKPELAVRLEDEAGRPVHAGRIAKIDIPAPYRLYNQSRLEGQEELVAPLTGRANIVAGPDGIAKIVLEPTLQTGKVTIIVTLDDGRVVTLFMYMEPEKRDWIIVGLAEGSVAYNSLKNESIALASGADGGLNSDGRLAFFAKGLIKGNWLLTLAVDTSKRRGGRDGDFRTEIDPNAYYTLYGDRSYTAFEAVSRSPLYIKLEKKSFYALFGDFETNITEGKLTRYSRHLSGIKAEYLGNSFQAMAFGAQTNQGFAKDEFAADGTSGPYTLSNAPILANSETITIETRDRTRADKILDTRRLIRHLDYVLDTQSGEIIFRLPVDATDNGFNPNVIVVDYETSQGVERNLTYGGRVQKQIFDGRIQIGSTFVHEGGNANAANGRGDIIGGEVLAQLGFDTHARAEYAYSQTNTGPDGAFEGANAYLAEIVHTSRKFTADIYVRSEDAGFGLRQRSSATNGVRRYGGNFSYKFSQFEDEKTGRRGSRFGTASAFREENIGTGNSRTSADVTLNHDGENLDASVGLRHVRDKLSSGAERQSLLLTAKAGYRLPKFGAVVQISREQALGGKDDVGDFPSRTRLSLDKTITNKASIRISHDILDGGNASGQNTAIGVSYAPWAGTAITASSDIITSDSGRRIGATVGLDQQFQISQKWSASLGLTNRRILDEQGIIEQIAPDLAISPLETNESFSSAYLGLGYRTEDTSVSARLETRSDTASLSYIGSLAGVRELSETLSFAGALRANFKDQSLANGLGLTGNATRIDGRLGVAWRPRDEGLIVLNRFDASYDNSLGGTRTTKLVNNLALNSQITDRWQLAGNYGVKYTKTKFNDDEFSGFTHLLGVETRYDITKRIDLGLHASALSGQNGGGLTYAYGPSIGVSPADNVWVSLGYNVEGFSDTDFTGANYSQKGPYLKLRIKFDQNSLSGLLDFISPKDQ